MKLIDLVNEKYMYPKGTSLKKGIGKMMKDIEHLVKNAKTWEKFEEMFRKHYPKYPSDVDSNNELHDLWDLYHSVQEAETRCEDCEMNEGKK